MIRLLLAFSIVAFHFMPSTASAQEKKPQWDQEKAVAMVNKVLATEQKGPVWDRNIKWSTDVEAVKRRAKSEGKPIFVYWYVKKIDSNKKTDIETTGSC